jgi:beta-galactosidase
MPFSDRVSYMSVLGQMYNALYHLNVEPDFVQAGTRSSRATPCCSVPPLYSASDDVLQQVAAYVKQGGHVVMAFKSGFTNEHSTVRHVMAPGPLRAAAGFRYQEFTSLAQPLRLNADPFGVGDRNTGSVWAEFLVPETAEVLASYDHPQWKFPAITRNRHGAGTLLYEGTVVTDELQREIVRDVLKRAGLLGPDQSLPAAIKVRHGRNAQGKLLHYYLNFSDQGQTIAYPYGGGSDVLTGQAVGKGQPLALKAWDLAIVAEK